MGSLLTGRTDLTTGYLTRSLRDGCSPRTRSTPPKGKRSVAFGLDWPGWSRGARSVELALETLESYRERYRPVADLAGIGPTVAALQT